jgi:hypothetical protein
MAIFLLLVAFFGTGILLMRFRKRWLARLKLVVTNRITSRFANRLAGFGIVMHKGRKSSRHYRTRVNVFLVPEGNQAKEPIQRPGDEPVLGQYQ